MTTSSGDASGNTKTLMGIVHNIIIKPTTETTDYTVIITNSSGMTVYERKEEVGSLSELVSLPVYGIYTVALARATNDEEFEIHLVLEEKQ